MATLCSATWVMYIPGRAGMSASQRFTLPSVVSALEGLHKPRVIGTVWHMDILPRRLPSP